MPVSIYPQNISTEMVAHRIDLIFTFLIRAAEFSDAPEIKLAAWNCMVMASSEGREPKFKHGLNLLLLATAPPCYVWCTAHFIKLWRETRVGKWDKHNL